MNTPRRLAIALLATGAWLLVGPTEPASADVVHLCSQSGYGCLEGTGYSGQAGWGYPGPHNCTLYAAFRLALNGYGNPAGLGDAIDWDMNAAARGVPVNTTPTVGSIAQSDAYGGHVMYVEVVATDHLIVTDDVWQGPARRTRIARPSPYYNSLDFLHFRDVTGRLGVIDNAGTGHAKDGLIDAWTPEIGPGAQALAIGGSGRLLAIDSAGNAHSKDSLTAPWTLQFSGASDIAVGPASRMMVTSSDGWAYAKDNVQDNWTLEAGPGVQAIDVGGNGRMMVIDAAGNAYSKDSLTAPWTLQFNGASDVAVGTNGRMMVTSSAGWAYAKDNVQDNWTLEAGPGVQAIEVG